MAVAPEAGGATHLRRPSVEMSPKFVPYVATAALVFDELQRGSGMNSATGPNGDNLAIAYDAKTGPTPPSRRREPSRHHL